MRRRPEPVRPRFGRFSSHRGTQATLVVVALSALGFIAMSRPAGRPAPERSDARPGVVERTEAPPVRTAGAMDGQPLPAYDNDNPAVGAEYYRKWSSGPNPSGDPNYFPISLWLTYPCTVYPFPSTGNPNAAGLFDESDNVAARARKLGVNMLLGYYDNAASYGSSTTDKTLPSQDDAACARNEGLQYIAAGWEGNTSGLNILEDSPLLRSVTKGYHIIDEPDMTNDAIPPSMVQTWSNALRDADATRPVHVNHSRGLVDPFYHFYGYEWAQEHLKATDILSADYYAVCDTFEGNSIGVWAYGRTVDRLFFYSNKDKPVWNFFETIFSCGADAPTISAAQLNSAVWLSVIHGATGIEYFCHNNGASDEGGCVKAYQPGEGNTSAQMKKTNELVRRLAPVINSPNKPGVVRVVSNTRSEDVAVDMMTKQHGGSTYIFTIANARQYVIKPDVYPRDTNPVNYRRENSNSTTATFSIPSQKNAAVEVVDEGVCFKTDENGEFRYDYDTNGKDLQGKDNNYKVHIYKVGGTACK